MSISRLSAVVGTTSGIPGYARSTALATLKAIGFDSVLVSANTETATSQSRSCHLFLMLVGKGRKSYSSLTAKINNLALRDVLSTDPGKVIVCQLRSPSTTETAELIRSAHEFGVIVLSHLGTSRSKFSQAVREVIREWLLERARRSSRPSEVIEFSEWLCATRKVSGRPRPLSHEYLVGVIQAGIRKYLSRPENVGMVHPVHGPFEMGSDLRVTFPRSDTWIGIQVKSPDDVERAHFVDKTIRQTYDALKGKPSRFFILPFCLSKRRRVRVDNLIAQIATRDIPAHVLAIDDCWSFLEEFGERHANPFKHLHPYTELDEGTFLGRQTETNDLVTRILRMPSLVVFGESGVGKSSLILAGVIPRLRRDAGRPVVIAVRLSNLLECWRSGDFNRLRAWIDAYVPFVSYPRLPEFLSAMAKCNNRRVFLVIDQFEELFTMLRRKKERDRFFAENIAPLLRRKKVSVVLVIRADFMHELSPYRRLHPGLWATSYRIDRITERRVQEIVGRTFKSSDVTIPSSVTRHLLEDLRGGVDGEERPFLPYVQIICFELFERVRRSGRKSLRTADYEGLAGAHGILRSYFDQQVKSLSRVQREIMEVLLPSLISDLQTRTTLTTERLHGLFTQKHARARAQELLALLIEQRIVIRSEDGEGFELIHDTMARHLVERQLGYAEVSRLLQVFHRRQTETVDSVRARFLIRSAYLHNFPALLWERVLEKSSSPDSLIEYLLELARDTSPDVRYRSLVRMRGLVDSGARLTDKQWQILRAIVEDDSEIDRVRCAAIQAAVMANPPEAVGTLSLILVDNPRQALRKSAAVALGQIGTEAALSNLAQQLKHTQESEEVLSAVLQGIVRSPVARSQAVDVLNGVAEVVDFRHYTVNTVFIAAETLAEFAEPGIVPLLLKVLEHIAHIKEFREQAARLFPALANAGDPTALPVLLRVLWSYTDGEAPDELVDAIGKLMEESLLNDVILKLEDENWFVRKSALECLEAAHREGNVSISYRKLLGKTAQSQIARGLFAPSSELGSMICGATPEVGTGLFRLACEGHEPKLEEELSANIDTLRQDLVRRSRELPGLVKRLELKDTWTSWYAGEDDARDLQGFQRMVAFWMGKPGAYDAIARSQYLLQKIGELFKGASRVDSRETKWRRSDLCNLDALGREELRARLLTARSSVENYVADIEKTLLWVNQANDVRLQGPLSKLPCGELARRLSQLIAAHEDTRTSPLAELKYLYSEIELEIGTQFQEMLNDSFSELSQVAGQLYDWNQILITVSLIEAYHQRRTTFAEYLVAIDSPEAKPFLLNALTEYCDRAAADTQVQAAELLTNYPLDEVVETIHEAIQSAIEDRKDYELWNFVTALGGLGSQKSANIITQLTEHPFPKVRLEALKALAKVDHRAAGPVALECIYDSDESVVIAAVEVSGEYGPEDALDSLIYRRTEASPALRPVLDAAMERLVVRFAMRENENGR
jgi:HEAT repeat protein